MLLHGKTPFMAQTRRFYRIGASSVDPPKASEKTDMTPDSLARCALINIHIPKNGYSKH